jgi:hypothetical protein
LKTYAHVAVKFQHFLKLVDHVDAIVCQQFPLFPDCFLLLFLVSFHFFVSSSPIMTYFVSIILHTLHHLWIGLWTGLVYFTSFWWNIYRIIGFVSSTVWFAIFSFSPTFGGNLLRKHPLNTFCSCHFNFIFFVFLLFFILFFHSNIGT